MKKYFKSLYPYILFFVISLGIVLLWFREGRYLGGGDVGLPFYAPLETFDMAKYLWWGKIAPGFTYSQTLSSLPLYGVLSLIQEVFPLGFQIQAIVTFIALFLSASAFYVLTGEFLNRRRVFWRLFAVGSYLFNPFMMDSVWHRFVYTTIIFSAVLPISIWLFVRLIKTKRISYFLILQLVLFVFSYVFGTFSHVITLWGTVFIFGILVLLTNRENIKPTSLVIWYILTTACWVLMNLWWILPQLLYSADFFTMISSIDSNLQTLVTISEKTPVQNIFRGTNPFYFFDKNVWGSIYTNPLFFSISWIPSLVIFVGYLLNRKSNKYLLFLLFWLLIVFVAKGSAPPMGGIFMYLFSRSFFVGVYRNAFEKIGILLPLISAFLITFSFMKVQQRLKKVAFSLLIVGYAILVWFVFLWPYWTGNVFGEIGSRDVINPPESYTRVNEYLGDNNSSYRVLHLPLVTGGITYNWDPVYSGIDPTHTFFDQEVISNNFGIEHIDALLNSLSKKLSASGYGDNFLPMIQALNVKYIVLHNDIDWRSRGLDRPEIIRDQLQASENVEYLFTDEPLEVYQVKDELLVPKVFLENNPFNISPRLKQGNEVVWSNSVDLKNEVYISAVEGNHQPDIKTAYTFAENRISISGGQSGYASNALGELPHARFLPGSPFYPLIRIKEMIEGLHTEPSGRFERMLEITGKRLVEIDKLVGEEDYIRALKQLEDYNGQIDNIVIENAKGNVNFGLLKPTLLRHYVVMEKICNDLEKVNKVESCIDNFVLDLAKMGILPIFSLDSSSEAKEKEIFRFNVVNPGEYEIVFKLLPEYEAIYPGINDGIEVFIDGHKETLKVRKLGELVTIGNTFFDEGMHEVGYSPIESVNLALMPDGVNAGIINIESGDHSDNTLTINISNHDQGSVYKMDFEYWVESGYGPAMRVIQDTDSVIRDKRSYVYEKLFGNDIYTYNWHWNSVGFVFGSREYSRRVDLEFSVSPWDDCIKNLIKESKCKLERHRFQKMSSVNLKNIQVKRLFGPELVLKNIIPQSEQTSNEGSITNLVAKNPTSYEFDLEVPQASYVIFSETYYPSWELLLDGERVDDGNHQHANIYANGWFVSTPGKYKAEISFSPQKDFHKFIIYSIVFGGIWIMVVCAVKRYFKKVL